MLNPNAVFRKTELGNAEIAGRKLGLRSELRRLLILVDGRNTVAKLATFVRLPEIDHLLYELQAQGLIDAGVGAAAAQAVASPSVMAATSADPTQVPTKEQFLAARSAAVHFVNDNLGPSGESLAIKLERTQNAQELRDAVAQVRASIERAIDAATAQRFLDHVRMSVKL
jgi:hypothetical protein